jgi:GT2 family glycosyltransferase
MNPEIPLNPDPTLPRFSIVIPHHDGSIPDALLLRSLDSLANQTFTNFEVLLFHDGPLSRPLPDLKPFPLRIRIGTTPQRFDDWGHSLRELGIQHARGDYIVHLDPDGVLAAHALQALDAAARAPAEPATDPQWHDNPEILVYAVRLRGVRSNGTTLRRAPGSAHGLLLQGYPVEPGLIEPMQLVAKRSLWRAIGGWYDRRELAAGFIYQALVRGRGVRYLDDVLAEKGDTRA